MIPSAQVREVDRLRALLDHMSGRLRNNATRSSAELAGVVDELLSAVERFEVELAEFSERLHADAERENAISPEEYGRLLRDTEPQLSAARDQRPEDAA